MQPRLTCLFACLVLKSDKLNINLALKVGYGIEAQSMHSVHSNRSGYTDQVILIRLHLVDAWLYEKTHTFAQNVL